MAIEGGDPVDWSYMKQYSPLGKLGTRDVVARATDMQLKISGESHVFLVTEHLTIMSYEDNSQPYAESLRVWELISDWIQYPYALPLIIWWEVFQLTGLGGARTTEGNTWTLRYWRNRTNRPSWGESIGIEQPLGGCGVCGEVRQSRSKLCLELY